jgi:hypothetical protein
MEHFLPQSQRLLGRVVNHFIKFLAGITDADVEAIILRQQELRAIALAL